MVSLRSIHDTALYYLYFEILENLCQSSVTVRESSATTLAAQVYIPHDIDDDNDDDEASFQEIDAMKKIQFNGLRYNLIGHFTFLTTLRKTMSKRTGCSEGM
ncbi:hypothetical protein Q3G72_015775 [Acer saccharum]|nr:hypothetical protein Q3G72_015775 [Acer saccharum]